MHLKEIAQGEAPVALGSSILIRFFSIDGPVRRRPVSGDMNIAESLDRVLNSKQIIGESFYQLFFERHPEVKPFFEGVNLQRQAVLVTMALIVIEQYYSNPYLATEKYVQYLGTKHHDRKIPKHLYAKWAETMLETLARFHGDDWSESLAKQWGEAILRVQEAMFQGYEEHFTV